MTPSTTIKLSNDNLIALLGCIYLFISTNPFVLWLMPAFVIYIPLISSFTILLYIEWYNGKLVFTSKRLVLFLAFSVLSLYLAIPIFWAGHQMFKIIQFFPLLGIIFLPDRTLFKIFFYFKKLLVFFAAASIILFFLLLININLPHLVVDGFTIPMQYNNDYYRVYYIVVSSTNTVYNIGGLTIARACGPFLEPGHFGIYLGFVLAFEKLIFNKINKLLIIAGFLTFSPAFYIILILLIVYEVIIKRQFKAILAISAGITIVFTFLLSDPYLRDAVIFLAWGRNVSEGGSIFDDRARSYTVSAYKDFAKTSSVIYGKGANYVGEIGVLSDPRGMIFKYGLLGLSLTIIILFIIFSGADLKYLFLLVSITALVYSHRSWMFESPYLYMLLFIGITSIHYNKSLVE